MNPSIRTAGRGLALVVLCFTQFMVALDVAVTNVALPSIQADLHVAQGNLQWVVTAYGLMLGGFLMLGGRLADLRGRKVILITGLIGFALASLAAGLAPNFTFLVVAWGVQGLGAAMISPAALSILTTIFAEGAERNRALGIWGAVSGSGAAAGILLSGIITDTVGWEWIFFINVPVGIALALTVRGLFTETRAAATARLDLPGAVGLTGSLMLLAYGFEQTVDRGWTNPVTLSIFAASAALMCGFVAVELRARSLLVRLGIFRKRTLSAANTVNLMLFGNFFGFIFITTLYMQQVRGWTALQAGAAWVPAVLVFIVSAAVASALVARIGIRPLLGVGLALMAGGLLLMRGLSVDSSYIGQMLPAFAVVLCGLGFAMVPGQIAALSGVAEHEAGLASGIINTSQEVGGALGVAVLASVALTHTGALIAGGVAVPLPSALVSGFQAAYAAGAIMAATGLVLALALIQAPRLPVAVPEPEELAA